MTKKKDKENVFASAAVTAQSNMKKLVSDQVVESKPTDQEETKAFSLRLPKRLHKKALQHRIETDESMNALIIRLLEEFFEDQE